MNLLMNVAVVRLAAVHASSFMSFVQLQVSLCSSQFIVPFSLQKQSETYICYTNKYKARLM